MKKQLIFLLLVCLALSGRIMPHYCVHDQVSQEIDDPVVVIEEDEEFRDLQANQAARPIRITYNISFLDTLKNTTAQVKIRENAEKALKVSIKYFTDLLMVFPKPPGSLTFNKTMCHNYQVPQIDTQQDQKNSDLHLYISYTNEPSQAYIAYAVACQVVNKVGPTHGLVNLNYAAIKSYNLDDPIVFDDLVETITHEITHVLGFSNWMIPQWIDEKGNPHVNPLVVKQIRGLNSTLLRTPQVLLHSRVYFGCSTGEGMPLENGGGSGSASHFEQTVIIDEIMNGSSSSTHAIFSRLTTAVLRDTGFYALVNSQLEEKSYYGKGAGCGFLYGECTSKREFCQLEDQQQKCDFYNAGSSRCFQGTFSDPKCYVQKVYSNGKCYEPSTNFSNTLLKKFQLGIGFGEDSRCFMSSLSRSELSVKTEQGLCYKFECNELNQVIIRVSDKKVTCTVNGEVLKVDGFNGTITCPDKLNDFCAYKRICPNHCSRNGYCILGKCTCISGYTGLDCSKKI